MVWVKANAQKPGEDPKAFKAPGSTGISSRSTRRSTRTTPPWSGLPAPQRAQQGLAVNLSRSGFGLMFSTMSLARTGIDEHERFLASIRGYKPIWTKWANSKMMQSIDFSGGGQTVKVVLDDMPVHTFEPETLGKSFARTLPDFILMIVLSLVFFAGAFVSFLKADVR
jgi:hypothetical protein